MAQFYEVLSQSDKSNEQPFYNNVEDQTVQYVITPDKTQTQYPTQQIVVTSGEQLMAVSGQSQQIVIDQSAVSYQEQTIQQSQVQQIQVPQQVLQQQQPETQVQAVNQQFTLIQDSNVSNGTQQIFFMESTTPPGSEQQVIQQVQVTQQPIVLNHQLGQVNTIARPLNRVTPPSQVVPTLRAAVRQPLVQQRPLSRVGLRPRNPNQVRQMIPNQNIIRQTIPSPQQQIRQPTTTQAQMRVPHQIQLRQTVPQQQQQSQQQIRQSSPIPRPTISGQQFRTTPNVGQQIRQASTNQLVRTSIPGQQTVLPNQSPQLRIQSQLPKNSPTGNPRFPGLVSIQQQLMQQKAANAAADDTEAKTIDDQETITLPDGSIITIASYKKLLADKSKNIKVNTTTTAATQSTTLTPVSKKRAAMPRARPPPKKKVATNSSPQIPIQQQQQQQQSVNDPSRYAMMNQQQMSNNPTTTNFQNQQHIPPNQVIAQQPQPQQQPQVRPSQANYVIQPPRQNHKPQQKRPLPAYIPSSQIQKIIENTPISEEFSDSIRMLVLLENGEQRLITFTLPKEACTIQEILEQVNVPFQANTNIQVTEANSNGINYIVTVGNVTPLGYEDEESQTQTDSQPCPAPPTPPTSLSQIVPQCSPPSTPNQQQQPGSPCSNSQNQMEERKSSSPEPSREVPRLVPGMLALCGACGYLSEDFSKCIRCQRKLPDNVKAIQATFRPAAVNGQKKDLSSLQQIQQQYQTPQIQQPSKPVAGPGKPASPVKKKPTKPKVLEQESVHVISSDEEEDEEKSSNLTNNLLQKLGASVTISPVTKEPSISEIQRHSNNTTVVSKEGEINLLSTSLKFRTIRIGSYRCIPPEKVIIDSTQVLMKVPHPEKEKGVKLIVFEKADVVKVLASFNPALPVIFYYLNPLASKKIRDELEMTADGDYYFDPTSVHDESFRRITFLPDEISEEEKTCLQLIWGPLLEELNAKEANDILIKTCPKEVARASLGLGGAFTEIKQLLQYPPEGRGRITINTEDYVCLARDQFLNDVIIDFYLQYLVNHLPSERKNKVHVFSTFFYKRLTTKPAKASRKSQPTELDPMLSPAQKRHARVQKWTKNVNLFEKDFIIVPINENAHWFLAIICFPGLDGCQTWDGKPYKLQIKSRKTKKNPLESTEAVSLIPLKVEKQDGTIVCEDPALSDKDEAEGDDSELESDDSEELPLSQNSSSTILPAPVPLIPVSTSVGSLPKVKPEPRPPIKQPCILIFDSLSGANRSRVVATLRDYLTCEFKAKLGQEKIYNKDVIKGGSPKVPQQNNFTDCGLYVLQYVEHFFKEPITDYNMPIKQIQHWFEEIIVTKKREDIAMLIKNLMREYGKDVNLLPDISFPTLNGKIVEHEEFDDEEEEEEEFPEEDEDLPPPLLDEDFEEKEDSMFASDATLKSEPFSVSTSSMELTDEAPSPIKPSVNTVNDFVVQPVLNQKPDLSEFPRQTNKDTLSILKAKRIIRHKSNGPEIKKMKSDD